MSKFPAFTITLMILALSATAFAESLFPADAQKSMYADQKACQVGDIVTIVIVESATSTQQASTNTQKESELDTGPGVGFLLERIPLFQYGGGDSIQAQGQTTRTSKFVTKMTAKVVAVDENGNLQIEGTRFVQTNSDKEEIKLTGTIRQQDIQPDNTVLSTYIADAKITHTGSGPVGSRQKEGLISRIFRILF